MIRIIPPYPDPVVERISRAQSLIVIAIFSAVAWAGLVAFILLGQAIFQ